MLWFILHQSRASLLFFSPISLFCSPPIPYEWVRPYVWVRPCLIPSHPPPYPSKIPPSKMGGCDGGMMGWDGSERMALLRTSHFGLRLLRPPIREGLRLQRPRPYALQPRKLLSPTSDPSHVPDPIPSHPPIKDGGNDGMGIATAAYLGGWIRMDGHGWAVLWSYPSLSPSPSIPPSKMGGAMEADDYYNLSRILEKYATL